MTKREKFYTITMAESDVLRSAHTLTPVQKRAIIMRNPAEHGVDPTISRAISNANKTGKTR